MANTHINKKKFDPLITQSLEMGKQISITEGGDWRKHAYEYYMCSQVAQGVIIKVLKENKQEWNELTIEEKAEMSQMAIDIVRDRGKAQQVMSQLGLH